MWKHLALLAALAAVSVSARAQNCTRDGLKAVIASYFKAVETHDMSALPAAPDLRITENGQQIKAGERFFKSGGSLCPTSTFSSTTRTAKSS